MNLLLIPIYLSTVASWIGLGLITGGVLGVVLKNRPVGLSLGDYGFLGLLFAAYVGQLLHFFVALSPFLGLCFMVLGLSAFCIYLIKKRGRICKWPVAVFSVVCATAFFFQSKIDAPSPDAGIYYVPSIIWISESPLTLGLANIHGRLAYNSIQWITAALNRFPMTGWDSAFMVNSYYALFLMISLFEHWFRGLREVESLSRSSIFSVVLLASFSADSFFFNGSLGSLSTDFPPTIIILYVLFLLIRFTELRSTWMWNQGVLLASLSILVKLSSLVIFFGVLILALLRRYRDSIDRLNTPYLFIVVVGLFLPWLLRNVALSGCLVWPLAGSCISNFPWSASPGLAANEARYILDYARGTINDPVTLTDWFEFTLLPVMQNHIGQLCLFMITVGILWSIVNASLMKAIWFQRSTSDNDDSMAQASIVLGICIAGIVFTWLKAPAFRFSLGFWYGMGAFLVTVAATDFLQSRRMAIPQWIIVSILIAGLGNQAVISSLSVFQAHKTLPAKVEVADVTTRHTYSGLDIRVSKTENCWAASQPCTPHFDPFLERGSIANRWYYSGRNEIAYRNAFPSRSAAPDDL